MKHSNFNESLRKGRPPTISKSEIHSQRAAPPPLWWFFCYFFGSKIRTFKNPKSVKFVYKNLDFLWQSIGRNVEPFKNHKTPYCRASHATAWTPSSKLRSCASIFIPLDFQLFLMMNYIWVVGANIDNIEISIRLLWLSSKRMEWIRVPSWRTSSINH